MGGRVSFKQFSLEFDEPTANWSVPISYTIDSDETQIFMLESEETEISLGTIPQKILANQKGSAAYRVLYSLQLMTYIIKGIEVAHDLELRDKFMAPIARAVFYQDLFHFTKVGKTDYQKLFRLSASLHEENDPVVWKAALDGFGWLKMQLEQTFDSRESDWFSKFIVSKLIGPYLRAKSITTTSTFVAKQFSTMISTATCAYGHEGCLNDQLDQFEKWKVEPKFSNILPLCVAIGSGNAFDNVFSTFNSTSDFLLAAQLAEALTCTKELDRMKELLLRAVSPNQPVYPYFSKIILKFSRQKYGHLLGKLQNIIDIK